MMIIAGIVFAAFLIGWFGGIEAYKYGLKNNPVMLPPKSNYDGLRNLSRDMEISYLSRLKEYYIQDEMLAKQRKEFYEKNPDFADKNMYMQVTAPPKRISIIEVS